MTNRREFIRTSSLVGLGFLGLYKYTVGMPMPEAGYGPLLLDPQGILNLPKGFSYSIISKQGNPMSDGLLVPGKPDGMATFKGGAGKTIIVRNHEISPGSDQDSPFGKDGKLLSKVKKEKFYDYGRGILPCTGGTTTLVYNHSTKKVEQEYLSLIGTIRNCAGGPTPWNTWITCEETIQKADKKFEKDHGYNFEVNLKEGLSDPIPLKAMGRFNHEAVAVDPATSIVYLTEDDHEGIFYRFIPNVPGNLFKGGTLQALVVNDHPSFDTRNWKELGTEKFQTGKNYDVHWITLDRVESPDNDLRHRGFKNGAARFARGEGIWYGDKEVYFACTNGGHNKTGQVFRYKPSPYEGTSREKERPGTLVLFAEPNNTDILKYCDNLTVSPWGDIVLAEDHQHPFLVGITTQGEYYKLAENTGFDSEFAGVVFSPDGSTLFVNIQHAGLTLAIEGPWKKG